MKNKKQRLRGTRRRRKKSQLLRTCLPGPQPGSSRGSGPSRKEKRAHIIRADCTTNYLQYKLCAGFSFPGLFFCNVVEYMDGYIELDYFGYVITMQISKPSLRNGTPV